MLKLNHRLLHIIISSWKSTASIQNDFEAPVTMAERATLTLGSLEKGRCNFPFFPVYKCSSSKGVKGGAALCAAVVCLKENTISSISQKNTVLPLVCSWLVFCAQWAFQTSVLWNALLTRSNAFSRPCRTYLTHLKAVNNLRIKKRGGAPLWCQHLFFVSTQRWRNHYYIKK